MTTNSDGRFFFNAFFGLVSVGSLSYLIKHQYEAYKVNKERKQAFATHVYSPTQLQQALQIGGKQIQNSFYQTREDKKNNQIRGRVFLSGLVKSDNPIKSNFFAGLSFIPVVYKIRYDQEVYSLDVQDPQQKTYTTMDFPKNAVFQKLNQFEIQDQQNQVVSSSVFLDNHTDVSQVLQYLGSKDHFRWRTITERIAGFLMFICKIISQFFLGKTNPATESIRGIKLGFRETEVGIKVDSPLLAYGEIVYDFKNNTCRMESPIALTNEKMQYIKQINKRLASARFLRNFCGVIFTATAIYFMRRAWHFSRKLKLLKKQDEIIELHWDQARDKMKQECPKTKERTDEELVEWLEKHEGQEPEKPCQITNGELLTDGEECSRCRGIFQQAKFKVLDAEMKRQRIMNNAAEELNNKKVKK